MSLIDELARRWRELSSFYALPEFDQAFTAGNAAEVLDAFSTPRK